MNEACLPGGQGAIPGRSRASLFPCTILCSIPCCCVVVLSVRLGAIIGNEDDAGTQQTTCKEESDEDEGVTTDLDEELWPRT
eukprot:scaffold257472_cov23-Tisochrysis_lutea.AAC.1